MTFFNYIRHPGHARRARLDARGPPATPRASRSPAGLRVDRGYLAKRIPNYEWIYERKLSLHGPAQLVLG